MPSSWCVTQYREVTQTSSDVTAVLTKERRLYASCFQYDTRAAETEVLSHLPIQRVSPRTSPPSCRTACTVALLRKPSPRTSAASNGKRKAVAADPVPVADVSPSRGLVTSTMNRTKGRGV